MTSARRVLMTLLTACKILVMVHLELFTRWSIVV
ncbi:hypothetical protein LINPERHAP1_LOCUS27301 [Linum perenne]